MKTAIIVVSMFLVLMLQFSTAAGLQDARSGGSGGLLRIPSASSLAHCPSRCGDVNISYPFGVGRGCFRQGFELTCDHTAHPPKVFLANTTTQITYSTPMLAMPGYIALVGFNVTMRPGVDTYNVSWEAPIEGAILSSFFNTLYVVGCNVDAIMFGDNITDPIGSCMSFCEDDRETMERLNLDGSCTGMGCCSINLLSDRPAFTLKLVCRNLTRAQLHQGLSSNIKVLLSSDFSFALDDLYTSWVNNMSELNDTMIEIAITDQPNCERARLNNHSYACNDESNCKDLPSGRGYSCWCPDYSKGNPYVLGGCIQAYDARPKETCTRSCGNMTIPFPFGIEEGCFANDDFQLNCTPSNVTVLDRRYAQYRVTSVSLDDGFLAASNMLNGTSSNNIERVVDSNYDGAYFFGKFHESVVDGIFDFSQEDEIMIKWVVANITCEQAMQINAMYACVGNNSYCQNVTRGNTHFGYRCKCYNGFHGNPYLQNNCTDIDECSIPNKCNGICHNFDGGFTLVHRCSKPAGQKVCTGGFNYNAPVL